MTVCLPKYRPRNHLLWMCTNEPEICNFITNDLSGGDMSIEKCDECKDGYLIVKKGTNGPVLGCTNYKTDGTGCRRLMSHDYYKRWLSAVRNSFSIAVVTGIRKRGISLSFRYSIRYPY